LNITFGGGTPLLMQGDLAWNEVGVCQGTNCIILPMVILFLHIVLVCRYVVTRFVAS